MFLVGIAGGSGSGKTTFTQKILSRSDPSAVAILHQDAYYLADSHLQPRVHGKTNFDHPGSFDWVLFKEHLRKLKRGERVDVPIYDYTKSRRLEETNPIGPCRAILVEGIYTLWDPEVRGMLDLKIYLHVESDIRFIRRLHRDVRERGRSLDSIIMQYYDTVRPMYHEYLEPTRQFADLVVGEETDVAALVVSAKVNEMNSPGSFRGGHA